jgi:hypothetical protein
MISGIICSPHTVLVEPGVIAAVASQRRQIFEEEKM